MRKGICCAGNILVDIVYPIEAWPRQSELTHITEGIRQAAGICLREEDGTLHPENMKAALQQLKDLGVSTWAVIHCPELGCGLDEAGAFHMLPSLRLPGDRIRGTVGASDGIKAADEVLKLYDLYS